jgi:predicted O-linked N-acetylglucosamine transferase (SPINDLY family)
MQHKKPTRPTPKQSKMIQEAVALHQSGQLDAAETQYRKLLNFLPSNTTLLTNLGVILRRKGKLEDAVRIVGKSLQINPNQLYALNNHGNALQDLGRFDEALASYDRAIVLKLDYADAYCNRGNALRELNRLDEALSSCAHAIVLKPDYADAYFNQGNALKELNRLDEALASYDHAITLKPDYAEAYSNRGVTLRDLKRLDDALVSYQRAITIKPIHPSAYYNQGNALQELKRLDEALASYERAIALKSDYAEAYYARGNALQDLNRLDEALASYEYAITLKPDYADTYLNRGNALKSLKRLDQALTSYEHAITLNPDIDFILGYSLHTKMHLCVWDDLAVHINELTHKINLNEKVVQPFEMLALHDDPNTQRKTAEIFAHQKYPVNHVLPKIDRYPHHSKIRIGYFSADFWDHPVSNLTVELYETHDRNQFEIYAFSFGLDTKDQVNLRIKAGVDHFHDVRALSDKEVAMLARRFEIDIAVDLGGFTANCRAGIFAIQAAPIQISYIGYLGTMGAHYYDYLVADQTIIPEKNQQYYSEKIAYLPSYQVNDSKQSLPTRVFTRQDLGLPETGFVFCCFNNTFKITPTTFDGWARILKQVVGSVLLLYVDNESAKPNLIKEIALRGIDANRFVFGKRLPMLDYLARYRVADLFLDTLPYNAGTTASDALRMGLPVLTCVGESFASRVAASLLNAVNLPELITTTQAQYESLAIDLALHPEKLIAIKEKLANNLPTAPLYNTPLFTKHLESAYLSMYDRYQKGLAPEHIYVEQ